MDQLRQDLRYAFRTLLKTPGFTAIAVVTLALGIGANTAIFSLVNALFLRPLAATEPERLATVHATRQGAVRAYRISFADYLDVRGRSAAFSGLAAQAWGWVFLGDGEDYREVQGGAVSGNFFPVLGLEPRLGRFFLPEEDEVPDAYPVTVLSHQLWRTHFAADPGVLGRTLRLNDVDCTVIGVAPEGFDGLYEGDQMDVWIPVAMSRVLGARDLLDRGNGRFDLLGRLAPGRALAEARAEMTVLFEQLAAAYPETHAEQGVRVEPAQGSCCSPAPAFSSADIDPNVHVGQEMPLVERTRMSFESERLMGRILGAASVLGLLLAALGLYGTMAFAVGRRTRELGIRMALGARPADVLTLVLGQGMRLALGGLALGGVASFAATRTLAAYLYGVEARDPATFAVVAALLVTVALVASYVPASRASRLDPSSALRHE